MQKIGEYDLKVLKKALTTQLYASETETIPIEIFGRTAQGLYVRRIYNSRGIIFQDKDLLVVIPFEFFLARKDESKFFKDLKRSTEVVLYKDKGDLFLTVKGGRTYKHDSRKGEMIFSGYMEPIASVDGYVFARALKEVLEGAITAWTDIELDMHFAPDGYLRLSGSSPLEKSIAEIPCSEAPTWFKERVVIPVEFAKIFIGIARNESWSLEIRANERYVEFCAESGSMRLPIEKKSFRDKFWGDDWGKAQCSEFEVKDILEEITRNDVGQVCGVFINDRHFIAENASWEGWNVMPITWLKKHLSGLASTQQVGLAVEKDYFVLEVMKGSCVCQHMSKMGGIVHW